MIVIKKIRASLDDTLRQNFMRKVGIHSVTSLMFMLLNVRMPWGRGFIAGGHIYV